MVDAFISMEAQQALRAIKSIAPGKSVSGLLIGHKRGRRFVVERAFPAPAGFKPSLKSLHLLDGIFEGKIIGFFQFHSDEKKERAFLQPSACGKFFLAIDSLPSGQSLLIGCLIDYDGRFELEPILVTMEEPRAKAKDEAPS